MNGIQVALVGRLPRDPADLRYTAAGRAMLSFSLAVQDAKAPEGAPTEWVRVTAWGDDAERLADELVKGSLVYVEGRGRQRTWTTSEGRERTDLEISAWLVQPLGVGRRRQQRGHDDQVSDQPRRMPAAVAVGAGRDTRAALGPDDDDGAGDAPF